MSVDRRLLGWGVFLLVLGAVPLAVQWGLVSEDAVRDLWRLWPLVLVGLGVGMLLRLSPLAWLGTVIVSGTLGLIVGAFLAGGFGAIGGACVGTAGGGEVSTQEGSTTGDRFAVSLELTCGDLEVTRQPGSTWNVQARHAPERPPRIEADDLSLTVASDVRGVSLAPFATEPRREWDITLPGTPSLSLDMTLNGASATMDLGGGMVASLNGTYNAASIEIDLVEADLEAEARLNMTFNAASGTLVLPAQSLKGNMTLNAASLRLCLAPEAALRIDHEGTLSSVAGGPGTVEHDGVVETEGYANASARIDLQISSTVSSISVDRDGTCE